jgi:ABC-2 type transport system permease protein
MPALILPQLLLCGLFVSRADMADALHAASWALPFTYAYDALDRATSAAPLDRAMTGDVIAIVGAAVAALGLGALTLRRRTA